MDVDDGVRRSRSNIVIRLGRLSWFALGIIALLVVAALALSAISGILVPLVVAVILANVLEPLVDRLKRIGVPAALSLLAAIQTFGARRTNVLHGAVHLVIFAAYIALIFAP